MAIVDIILKIDTAFLLKEIVFVGDADKWFQDNYWEAMREQKIDYILGHSIKPEGGIVELQNKFFKYQWIKGAQESTVFLSRDGVLLELYEQTIRYAAEGIQIYDRNGYFLYANPASEDLEFYKNEDFKGKHILDLYDLKEEYSTILTVLRTQKPVINRCDRFKMKTGKALTTINNGYPLKIDDILYGAVVFESDLSALKRIKNRTTNLEAYVEGRQSAGQEQLYTFDDIVHVSDKMKNMILFAKKVSLTDSSVLIVGATGTGKELMAQSIHSFSPRRDKPFIDINCSAVPSNLFESLFFGTEKGAFTGSVAKKGFFEMADGGTIFLDEVNSINVEMQAKLLRVLQEKRFQRIGGQKYLRCDVRVIAAANEDLYELMKEQKIRKDFYYRLSAIKIDILPLNERKEDIPILARYFLIELCNQYNRPQLVISKQVLDVFLEYNWPGNVRELQHVMEYVFNCAPEDVEEVGLEYLPDYLLTSSVASLYCVQDAKNHRFCINEDETLENQLAYLEKEIIYKKLQSHGGNITKTAKSLGISRQSLQYRMKKVGITAE
ncbi:arginine utilization regulatory protein [Geosporobacter subterraneus DSM 17957]|uniref:Arginine utilization regulatory protein n=1 Tax=Geosporobacter subterraneus DSM 17957 TaxID=1121919 RepID=A0A1M6H4S3_9FIRM|nr:sigma 54-interacting transcriptional regulator [Geosporobacter subterraneus]SHJ17184.1 arginine utilization regulatory protein [Geosporobacter subterraneus DSM 17957]